MKNDAFLNFVVNQEKHIGSILKNLFGSNSMSRKMRKSVELVEAKLGNMYGLCKAHEQEVNGWHPFRPIISALHIPIYNLAKFLVPILNTLTKKDYTVKDSFRFAEEILL